MVNFAIDPRPHAPRGFEVPPHDPAVPPMCLFAYISGCMEEYNEDLAIAFLVPAISKQDFEPMAAALQDFFIQSQGVRLAEVQPSPIGDTFVRFNSPVEHERFLDRIIQFGPDYQLRFIKHDAGDNVRMHDLDREAWLMLMLFPNDVRSNIAISKSVAGFGLVRYFQQCKDSAHVYVLERSGVTILSDEDFFPSDGPLHPVPMNAPRWMGINPVVPNMAVSEAGDGPGRGSVYSAHVVSDEAMSDAAAAFAASDHNPVQLDPTPSVHSGAAVAKIPTGLEISSSEVIKSLNLCFSLPRSLVSHVFSLFSAIVLVLDTIIPSYIADDSVLLFLASISVDQNAPSNCLDQSFRPRVCPRSHIMTQRMICVKSKVL
ncbi:hypothetical protein BAE44_0016012 [Dichanthelium oligosanthes]|uniref:DUF7597 domain-containing protein n=1 Tax=Dichanthelium oligosanthes TaxID=888268 RepID=A0A1E5VCU9_9POAL|nr:hypothetical protein BAE44_0016012 [Dichanthelium oligosanthes]